MAASASVRTYAGGYVYLFKVPANNDKVTIDLEDRPRGGAHAVFGPGRGIGITARRPPSGNGTTPEGSKVEVMYGKPAAAGDEIRKQVIFSDARLQTGDAQTDPNAHSNQHVLLNDPSITQIELTATAASAQNAYIVNSPVELQYALS